MSDIPRYKPVSNDRLGIADDADGKLCEYRDYEKLKSTVQSFAANVLRLGNEVRDLARERDTLKAENEELHKDYEALADEHTKLIDRNKTLKAEVERLRKAGDAMADELIGRYFGNRLVTDWNAAKEGKPSV